MMTATILTRGEVARRWKKAPRTLFRYERERPAGYPVPFQIHGRWHYRLADVERFEAALIGAALGEAA